MAIVATEEKQQECVDLLKKIAGMYDFSKYQDIVMAIRTGKSNLIPNGTEFTVPNEYYGNVTFVVRRKNVDKAADDSTRPTITIQTKYLLSTNEGVNAQAFQFDRPEAFASVDSEIAAGTVCKFAVRETYSSWAAGTYNFTATAAIPAGAKLCFNGYADAALTARKVSVYAEAKATSASANYTIASGEGGATVDLGTISPNSATENTKLNHAHRISYGSNNYGESAMRQILNGTGMLHSIWQPQTKYDMMPTTNYKCFYGGFPKEFRDCLAQASVYNPSNTVFESQDSKATVNGAYTTKDYFWLPSFKEVYNGQNAADKDGANETQLPYYAECGVTAQSKTDNPNVKYALMYAENGASTHYWLRTCHPWLAFSVRICYTGTGGAADNISAINSYGACPLAILA